MMSTTEGGMLVAHHVLLDFIVQKMKQSDTTFEDAAETYLDTYLGQQSAENAAVSGMFVEARKQYMKLLETTSGPEAEALRTMTQDRRFSDWQAIKNKLRLG